MPPGIGYSFQPGAETLRLNQQGGRGVAGLSPQEAVKFLSLRLPERPSPTQIAPQALLRSSGMQPGGMGGGADLRAVIEGLMQLFSGGQQGPQATPRVRPPIDDPNANTQGDLVQQPPVIPPQDFPNPGQGDLNPVPAPLPPTDAGTAPPFDMGATRTAMGRKSAIFDYAPPLF